MPPVIEVKLLYTNPPLKLNTSNINMRIYNSFEANRNTTFYMQLQLHMRQQCHLVEQIVHQLLYKPQIMTTYMKSSKYYYEFEVCNVFTISKNKYITQKPFTSK